MSSTLDLSVIDEIVHVTEKEAFQWTRRIVREEGIICGVSSGAALARAMRYLQELPSDRLAVVIFPDSGSRYLSKVFDDKWMRKNGFMEYEWGGVHLGKVLAQKHLPGLVTASLSDWMTDVIARLKEYDISQLPVLHPDGSLASLVTKVDLLKHMMETRHTHNPDETIEPIIQAVEYTYSPRANLEDVLPKFYETPVILVLGEERPIGILTKIDVLDFIARKI